MVLLFNSKNKSAIKAMLLEFISYPPFAKKRYFCIICANYFNDYTVKIEYITYAQALKRRLVWKFCLIKENKE